MDYLTRLSTGPSLAKARGPCLNTYPLAILISCSRDDLQGMVHCIATTECVLFLVVLWSLYTTRRHHTYCFAFLRFRTFLLGWGFFALFICIYIYIHTYCFGLLLSVH
ncbi:hypothetical protein B0H13DRAFT_1984913 [Mycena leptocephala]|nr:hypothetical protein B0H13DRAFT_1984913 [Mycena leptocephala]